MAINVTERNGEARFEVRARPRAKRAGLDERDGALVVAVTAAPEAGEANAEIAAAIADVLGVGRSAVVILRGERSRKKVVAVRAMTAEVVRARLEAALEKKPW